MTYHEPDEDHRTLVHHISCEKFHTGWLWERKWNSTKISAYFIQGPKHQLWYFLKVTRQSPKIGTGTRTGRCSEDWLQELEASHTRLEMDGLHCTGASKQYRRLSGAYQTCRPHPQSVPAPGIFAVAALATPRNSQLVQLLRGDSFRCGISVNLLQTQQFAILSSLRLRNQYRY